MKAKIAQALKTSYANMGLSEEALNGVASLIEKTVKEESEIATAIAGDEVKNLLKVFQSSDDSNRSKIQKLTKDFEDYKKAHPVTDDKDKDKDKDKPDFSAYEARIKALEDAAKAAEKKAADAVLANAVRTRLEKDCKDAPILKQVLKGFSIAEGETEDAAVTRLTAEYNATVKEIRGEGYIPPMGGGDTGDEAAFLQTMKDFAKSKGLVKDED